jgi:ABC-type phosphate/phosphonate transport system permease subunit
MDERYLMHRLRSTSIAGIVGAVAIGSWILYQFYVKDIFRWDLFVILMIIGLVKIGAMIYYRRTD